MGLLDGLLGGGGAQGQGGLGQMLLGLLANSGGGTTTGQSGAPAGNAQAGGGGILGSLLGAAGGGGLGQLVGMFQEHGMGDIAHSWVGNGQNQSVTPDQLHNVLGADQVQSMANQSGMQPNDMLTKLASILPSAVDRATPGGQLPPDSGSEPMFDSARA